MSVHPMASVIEPIMGVWGYAPNGIPGAEPMVGGLGDEVPQKLNCTKIALITAFY